MANKWTEKELFFLRMNYSIINTNILVKNLNKSKQCTYKKAKELGLKKQQIVGRKEYFKLYREKNKKHIKEKINNWYQENKNKCAINQKIRLADISKKKKRAEYYRNKRKTDINHKLRCSLRERLNKAIKFDTKKGSSVKDLGCSIEKFKLWLEMNFKNGMNWDNHNLKGWHIDHIRPLDSFDLTDREQFLEACHFTNLQPLWAEDNLRKGCIYDG